MRVVAGRARGRRLVSPRGRTVRPTSDRVREATFNALSSLDALEDASVLDLFAGSGALGIEALSRGAAAATFVDHDPAALAAVRANLATTGLAAAATVVRSEASRFVASGPGRFDVALLDPPYDFDGSSWSGLLDLVDAGLAVLESDREIDPGERWEPVRVKRYGATVVTLVRLR
ncbi:MAG: 16S rRNA (guanine(966)-N(2))-methyltransferase RsmD [Actinobacteria bacterium]|nr:16S rRNA (guanine(966)-N(2))-methyltransferase RsmD [Actinomycetota bacterium]